MMTTASSKYGRVKGVPMSIHTDEDKVDSSGKSSGGSEIDNHTDSGDPTGTNATRESENAKSASSGTKDSFIRNLGRHETVAVLRSKACVYFVLAIAAVLVGAATCRYVVDTENAEFEREVSLTLRILLIDSQLTCLLDPALVPRLCQGNRQRQRQKGKGQIRQRSKLEHRYNFMGTGYTVRIFSFCFATTF
jgi:hypothetical protein